MFVRSNVKLAITGALMLFLFGVLQGCGEDPTAPTRSETGRCVWINGQIHCTG